VQKAASSAVGAAADAVKNLKVGGLARANHVDGIGAHKMPVFDCWPLLCSILCSVVSTGGT
jgi:hypothetical protein